MDIQTLLPGKGPHDIRNINLPGNLKALVLAPHPDDFDAIGVTLGFLSRNGNPLEVAVARTGSGVEECYRPGLTLADKAGLREREQRDSLRFFGLSDNCLTFLTLTNDAADQPIDNPENRVVLEEFVSQKGPNLVFLPHGNDTNTGHQAIYSLVTQVARDSGRPLALFLNRDPKTIQMHIDLYISFGQEEAAWKAKLLRFHDSQQQRNLRTRGYGFDDRILDANRQIARELSLDKEYAEAFELEFHGM